MYYGYGRDGCRGMSWGMQAFYATKLPRSGTCKRDTFIFLISFLLQPTNAQINTITVYITTVSTCFDIFHLIIREFSVITLLSYTLKLLKIQFINLWK